MQFERLRKNHKKQIIIGAIAVCVIGGILTFATSRAFYRVDDSIDLAKGTINYKAYDFKIMAMYKSDDKTNYIEIDEMPSEGYIVNEEKSYCTTDNKTEVKGKVKTINGNVAISNLNKNDKCFIWFDRLDDEKPIISNVTTSVTKTEINVTVTTTDNIGVTEYWYQIDSNEPIKGTGNTYKFTGLSAGSTHTIKVYVKDAAGNKSDTTEKNVTTDLDEVILINRSELKPPNFSYSIDGGVTWVNITTDVASITVPIGTIIKSNTSQSVSFCSQVVSNCESSSSSYLGYAKDSNIYTVNGNEAVFNYYCLAEDTLIVMYDDKKRKKLKKKVKDIKVGDKIYAYDNNKNKLVISTVKKIEVTHHNIICVIKLKNGEIIECSKEHGFYVENREFMMACELKPGLKIMGMDGINYEISEVEIKRYENDVDLYNILIEDGNSIFITSLKVMSYATTFMVGFNLITKRDIVLGSGGLA